MMNNKEVDNLDKNLKNADNLSKLSASFDDINKAFNNACVEIFKSLFDYEFSTYLYYHFILKNESKSEIAKNLNLAPSTIYYYIKKYKLKKDKKSQCLKMLETMKVTCNERYGVDHPGELPETHSKRIENILNKTNGHYDKEHYKALNKSEETKKRMSIAQQYRRQLENEGDYNERRK